MAGETLFDKIWRRHVVRELEDDAVLIHIDRHIIHDCTSGAAFASLARADRKTRRPDLTYAVIDHILPTQPGRSWDTFEGAKAFVSLLRRNTAEHGIGLIDVDDPRQGIEHVIAAELGIPLPGTTLVCGDSHTAACGATGCLAWGIGTSEVAHVLATQTIVQRRPKRMRVRFEGRLRAGVHSKDMILAHIGRIGIAAGTGHAVEYAGGAVRALAMDARQTICNMSIEFGARSGMIAPHDTTLAHSYGRAFAPTGALWDEAVAYWRTVRSDDDSVFDREVEIDCSAIEPQVAWGTTPGDVVGIGGRVPDPSGVGDTRRRQAMERALAYMGLHPRDALEGLRIDVAFIGSCTNSRLTGLEAAARVLRGRMVAPHVRALVAPGSAPVKRAAEAMGLDKVFTDAGFEWRESGCSLCVAINDDSVGPDQRCISTSNRNFENRQGPRSRTHNRQPGDGRRERGPWRHRRRPQARRLNGGTTMEKFARVEGPAASFPKPDIDTDAIIPAAWQRTLIGDPGKGLFGGWRYHLDGSESPNFILNREPFRQARVIGGGMNLGCGSSREFAVWALMCFGIRCVIAPSFGDIFYENSFKNGLLPIILSPEEVERLHAHLAATNDPTIAVDLERCEISLGNGETLAFRIPAARRTTLLEGLDEIGATLKFAADIDRFQSEQLAREPWVYAPKPLVP